ncbi:MAG TPA: membrane dipeptidase [Chitinophagales bacterium]|nr:membrane dipeptidase [Chitinophagales bacterium]
MKKLLLSLFLLFGVQVFQTVQAQLATADTLYHIDVHAHISLKPYNRAYGLPDAQPELWCEQTACAQGVYRFPNLLGAYKKVPPVSCCNFNNLVKGDVKIAFASVCPIQREFTQNRFYTKLFLWNRYKLAATMAYFAGSNTQKILDLQNNEVNYFTEAKNELNLFMKSAATHSPNGKNSYRVAYNYADIAQNLAHEPDAISVVLNIEGAHALGTGIPHTLRMEKKNPEQFYQLLTQNVTELKQNYPIFSLTLANHFWNQLCGQTRTSKGLIAALINERRGQKVGITPFGYHVIDQLLSTQNGNRILIDIKHMSLKSRLEYYQLLNEKYQNNIPILYSHGGVNGIENLETAFKNSLQFKRDRSKVNKKSYLHQWSFNLYDDEIKLIHQSKGLIGIMLEDTRLGGKVAVKSIKKTIDWSQQQKDEYIKLFMASPLHIVKVIGNVSAWDIIALGSDFDGAINPMDTYQDASRMQELRFDVIDFLYRVQQNRLAITKERYLFDNAEIVALMYGLTPEQIADKMLRSNALNFLANNF